ncbi:MAG: NAD(P)/FAD-dependent oxidoreductase [Gammaproteobacteria bacterium]|nr:NAD(P)/FAD-dependent oxidoreductase [Gammaproteobacteria bacterium]MDH5799222.1 NAD(P)/FAD-dependent oxidoreductase [Gammaproteobacteria bacterium]
MSKKVAVIIGAGPAGLTAAYELLEKSDIKPVIFEMTSDIGGISKTVNYKGNRIDIGGHRFFSKSDRVMDWWRNIMPLQGAPSKDDIILKREVTLSDAPDAPDPEKTSVVMLIRRRLSRIFFLRSFFDYPISLKWNTFKNLGIVRIIRIGLSYVKVSIFPIKEEKSLEEFLINRFGRELYLTFFKDYTEKVWGVPCNQIKPDWGAQRIKGLSITKSVLHAIKTLFKKDTSVGQKNTETSLIEQFMYPKLGPGQMWEEVARIVTEKGAELHFNKKAVGINLGTGRVASVAFEDIGTGEVTTIEADYVFSTMAVKDLVEAMSPGVPENVLRIASGLTYRDFITVGVLLNKLKIDNETNIPTVNSIVPDNWIYIQERDVKLGRLQIFNNWSPYMVKDPDTVWLGMEYFCYEGDELWSMSDKDMSEFAVKELEKIDIIDSTDVLDTTVIKMPKTYPAYFGTYNEFDVVKDFVDGLENLFLVGRNGMHKYNNADHSMLTAMVAVENIVADKKSKENIWKVNVEQEYHEEKS